MKANWICYLLQTAQNESNATSWIRRYLRLSVGDARENVARKVNNLLDQIAEEPEVLSFLIFCLCMFSSFFCKLIDAVNDVELQSRVTLAAHETIRS